MSSDTDRRLTQMLNAALHSPNFAVRLLHQSPAPERAEVVRRWSQPSAAAAPAPALPGLRKCKAPRAATQSQDMAVQLAAFARSVRSVGPESA
jgi:cell division septation protein DedD